MQTRRVLTVILAGYAALMMAGCGADPEYLVAIQISPAAGTATASSANNTVKFAAIGWYATLDCSGYGGCIPGTPNKHQTLTNATWVSSDSLNTSIDSSGVATCLSATATPATIHATASGGYYGSITGSGTLICI